VALKSFVHIFLEAHVSKVLLDICHIAVFIEPNKDGYECHRYMLVLPNK